MRILLYEWPSYLQSDIEWVCREQGIKIEKFTWKFKDKNVDDRFEKWFAEHIDTAQFGVLFSINYWPLLSQVAQKNGIGYIAWCYDNPLNVVRIEETLGNPVNTVVFFDRIQMEKYKRLGFDTVHYMPLCVNRDRLQRMRISRLEQKRYGCDVSLVGSLYESRYQEIRVLVDERTQGYLDAALSVQQNLYGVYLFDEMLSDELVEEINGYIKEQHPDTEFKLLKEALNFAMASEVTRRERLLLLKLLGRYFDTRLYSFQSSEILQEVKCFPAVDYVEEMPKVFACTKINLNPSLKCIQSGIPLRALDVMGAGGFLLSNYQAELAEQFADGKEMVQYESVEDAFDKAKFYLAHEDLRRKIALEGQRKVFEKYAIQERFAEIFALAGMES